MDSPFTSRLDSNYVATDSEFLEIQTLLKPHTSRLEGLSTQLQELDDQYTKIRNEQSSLLLLLSKHRALISLIRKLPIDILQKIFIACLPTTHNAVMSRWEPPILLTQICSSWRNVAHATPHLWNSIHISVPYNLNFNRPGRYYPREYPKPVEYIDRHSEAVLEWFSRSAAYSLDISFGHWGNSALGGFYDKIIDCLIRFSERWRDVRLSAPYEALVPVVTLPPSKVPLLETLSFEFRSGGQDHRAHFAQLNSQSIWITSGVLKAPKLHGLSLLGLRSAHVTGDVTRLPINWSQLTNISLEGTSRNSCFLSVSRAYKLLSLCRNLITCRLEILMTKRNDSEEPPFELDTTTALISLPFLTRLTVHEGSNLSRLFTLLHLPSLNCIEFYTTVRPTQESSTSLLSLLTHSHNTTQLITDSQFFTRQDFIKCLRLCPLLKTLSTRLVHIYAMPDTPPLWIDDAFLKLFIESSNDEGYLCPNLEDFECSDTAFDETALLQFVKEKNGNSTTGLARLKHLSVVFYSPPLGGIDIIQELEPYKQTGLVSTITYPVTPPFSAFSGLPGRLPLY